MKKFLACLLAVCLAIVPFVFAGCESQNSITLSGGPLQEDEVAGNGSFVVKKGDYIYFASGYVKTSDLGTGGLNNNLGSVENGALFRAKVEYQSTGTQGEEDFTEKMVVSNAEMLLSKVVGFDDSGLYIFGDKIYFGTPATTKDNNGKDEFSEISFYSMNLNGLNLTKIYQTAGFKNGEYVFVEIEDVVYLIINTGSSLLKVGLNGKVEILAENVLTSVIANDVVYYTLKNEKSTDSVDYGAVLYSKNIKTLQQTTLFDEDYLTLELVKFENNKLYYTRNYLLSAKSPSTSKYIYSNTLQQNFADGETKLLSQAGVTKVVELEEGLVYINNSKLYLKRSTVKQLASSASKILAVKGNFVYYADSSAIYRINVGADNQSAVKLSGSTTISADYFDLDGNFVYFFVKNSETSKYEINYVDIKYLTATSVTPTKIN